jgi:hypothetical protein
MVRFKCHRTDDSLLLMRDAGALDCVSVSRVDATTDELVFGHVLRREQKISGQKCTIEKAPSSGRSAHPAR